MDCCGFVGFINARYFLSARLTFRQRRKFAEGGYDRSIHRNITLLPEKSYCLMPAAAQRGRKNVYLAGLPLSMRY